MGKDPKKYVLEHSLSKLRFYREYLERYLNILSLSEYIKNINIFDIFCGTGIYRDGNHGSPIIAFNAIRKSKEYVESIGKKLPEINLIVNDGVEKNIISVKKYLDIQNLLNICNIQYFSLESDFMFDKVQSIISSSSSDTRNLIFIDPYGYKEIHRIQLESLLKNRHSEIILFLPVSHMYRFLGISKIDEENMDYEKLRCFINEFFEYSNISIPSYNYNIFDFINDIKESLNFKNQYYSSSFYIKRNQANYNAVFFITSHIFGFENMINVKWQLDNASGKGSTFIKSNYLFVDSVHEGLRQPLLDFLKENSLKTNKDIYLFTLQNEYKTKHATAILDILKKENIIEVIDSNTKKVNNRGFYINYKYYKLHEPKVYIRLK